MASILQIRKPNDVRTPDHNARFHAMVRDISKQLTWADDRLSEEDWKRLLLAAKFGQKVVPNPLAGVGFIVTNTKRSRSLTNEQMEEMLGEITAFGDERGVVWSKPE